MERKRFWEQSWLGLRALAVITVMLLTGTTAWADGVKYIDADGNEQTCTTYTLLTGGGFTKLPGGWYVAEGNVAYTDQLEFTGDAHLILADGCNMTVRSVTNNIIGSHAIYAKECNLTIYGQGGMTEGMLTTTAAYGDGILATSDLHSVSLTINGGQVKATSTNSSGIHVSGVDGSSLTINGGQVTATSTSGSGISSSSNSGSASITLGWTNATDYIYASSYKAQTGPSGTASVKTADGKAMKAFIPAATENDSDKPFAYIAGGHTLTATELTALAGKVLRPASDEDITIKYLDWDDSQKKLVSKNTATDTDPASADPTNPDPLTANDFVYVLQGGAGEDHSGNIYTELPGGWYVAEGNVSYTSQLLFTGDAHIILADEAKMNVDANNGNIIHHAAIQGEEASLAIYGQENGTGSITATGITKYSIAARSANDANVGITFNGGQFTATNPMIGFISATSPNGDASIDINGGVVTYQGSKAGILVISTKGNARITINGGKVETTSEIGLSTQSSDGDATIDISGGHVTANCYNNTGNSIVSYSTNSTATVTITGGQIKATGGSDEYGIVADGKTSAAVNISGGQVTATGGICGIYAKNGDITLGWTSATDFIQVSNYRINGTGSVKTAAGKGMKAFIPAATEDDSEKEAIYIQGKDAGVTLPAAAITAIGGKVLRPATNEDVAITYLDWDDSQKKLVSKNTLTDGNDANDIVYVLTGGGATTLPAGWYVVNDWNTTVDNNGNSIDAAYTGQLKFTGDAHLILADGSEMTVINTAAGESAIYGDNASLTICAQSEGEGMGDLLAINYNSDGIYVNATGSGDAGITINSGIVGSIGRYHGFYAKTSDGNATVTVNGGEINGGNDGFVAESSGTGNATVTFNGGMVHAAGADYATIGAKSASGAATVAINGGQINSDVSGQPIVARSTSGAAKITLGWTVPSDFIRALKYVVSDGGTVCVADGQYLTNYSVSKAYSGTLDDTELDAIGGEYLYPAMSVAGGEKYVSIYRLDCDWKLSAGVKAYVVTGYDTTTGTVTLSETPLKGLPAGVPVILVPDGDNLPNQIVLASTGAFEAAGIENSVPTTISPLFTASDGTKTMADLIYAATGSNDTSDYLAFVLEKGVFKPVAFSDSSVPAAGTCILFVNKLDVLLMIQNAANSTSSARQRGIPFDLGGGTTGIERPTPSPSLNGGEIYDLQGRRLDQAPKAKGVYIRNGIKVVVK